jgi:iron complex outermembrane recepter protein
MAIRQTLLMTCAASALVLGGAAVGGQAFAAAASANASENSGGTTVGELVVTAEKREQNLQTVPVAISAYTAAKRQLIGIDTIQDMTNFTPGLEYNSSTDRISLRGVGRQTNVLSADASVANYSDGVYETFAVGAGASTLFLDRVEVLRGPQGTLYGRNAIGGAINEISRHPTTSPYAEIRGTYSNYNHYNIEAAISGPITDNIQARLAGNFEQQTQGWVHNNYPGAPDEGNIIKEFYLEEQIQWKISDKLDFWEKVGFNQWANGSGGPGAASAGWTPFPYNMSEYSNAATQLNPGYACQGAAAGLTNIVNLSPTGCNNPAMNSPWQESRALAYKVDLPYAYTIAAHLTYHLPFADVKYITGGVNYHYILTGPSGGTNGPGYEAPVSSFTIPGVLGNPLVINPQENFVYQELNAFWSHEINIISTAPGPFQWVLGGYYYRQHYQQPVYTENGPNLGTAGQPQWNGPFPAVCNLTGGLCPDQTDYRRFDNRPSVTNVSYAAFAQVDYKLNESWKFTGGIRYSHDEKYGSESVRILCFAVANCVDPTNTGAILSEPNALGGYTPAIDLTQVGSVVDQGVPVGVTGPTTFNPATGFATRYYDADWQAVTGTAGIEWTPDSDTLVYAKYSRGYKSGGYNIGIFTVLSFLPYTAAEHVDSYELGFKKTWMRTLTTDIAAFYYSYNNLQIPVTITTSGGGLSTSQTTFYNVPSATSRGVELETTWQPDKHFAMLFDYSYLDAYSNSGALVDEADPDATFPGAKPLACSSITPVSTPTPANPGATPCITDIYTGKLQRFQSLAGNRLPNAPRNKIALNANYTFFFEPGTLNLSGSYIWRDTQEGTLFTRPYNTAPAWDEFDARVTFTTNNQRVKVIAFVKNIGNTIGYDAGAYGTRYAGVNVVPSVQNGKFGFYQQPYIEAPGIGSTYSVTPPRTYGVEIDYKFF